MVEEGPARTLLEAPAHPYTQALLAAVPRVDGVARTRQRLEGDLPSPLDPPRGCRFHTRCPKVMAVCRERVPRVTRVAPGHTVACHLHGEGP